MKATMEDGNSLWTEKYRPDELDDVYGNNDKVEDLLSWSENWSQGDDGALLHGIPGVGKTTSVKVMANEQGYDIVHFNASDERNREKIKEISEESRHDIDLVIMLDEVDSLASSGSKELNKLLKSPPCRIVLIGNELYEISRGIRNKTQQIEFESVNQRQIVEKLYDICKQEGFSDVTKKSLREIARKAGGDMRAAINDLQSCVSVEKGKVDLDSLQSNLGYSQSKRAIIFGSNLCEHDSLGNKKDILDLLTQKIDDYDTVRIRLDEGFEYWSAKHLHEKGIEFNAFSLRHPDFLDTTDMEDYMLKVADDFDYVFDHGEEISYDEYAKWFFSLSDGCICWLPKSNGRESILWNYDTEYTKENIYFSMM